jgi:excisionase family DNA binding protein
MTSISETLAFLHAHGLDIEPEELSDVLRSAVGTLEPGFYGAPGAEGLTAGEVEVARRGGLVPEAVDGPDPMVRAVVHHAGLLKTGLTTATAAARLGVTDARIRQRIEERSLFAMRSGHRWRLPDFQFVGNLEVPGWSIVCRRLPNEVSPVALDRWLRLPHPDLVADGADDGLAPLQWLHQGRLPDRVAELASSLS